MAAPPRIPPRNADRSYLFYEYTTLTQPRAEEKQFLSHFFKQCNNVIAINSAALENKRNTFFFALSRALVSELDILRYAVLQADKLPFWVSISDPMDLNAEFRRMFGKVRDLRNIIQHHGEYTFGNMKQKHVKPSEVKRLKLPFEDVKRNTIARITEIFLDDSMLVSSDHLGNLCEVYIGAELPTKVAVLCSHLCDLISSAGHTHLRLLTGLTEVEVRQMLDANR